MKILKTHQVRHLKTMQLEFKQNMILIKVNFYYFIVNNLGTIEMELLYIVHPSFKDNMIDLQNYASSKISKR